jgi:circadian clock protein KaiC
MHHSNQIREFILTDQGVKLVDVYLGAEGVLTGSARLAQEARERAAALTQQEELAAMQRRLDRRRTAAEAQISALRAEIEAENEEVQKRVQQMSLQEDVLKSAREAMASVRGADSVVLSRKGIPPK